MATSKTVRNILDDMNKTIAELHEKNLLRDSRGTSVRDIGKNLCEISFSGKNDTGSIVFDKHITSGQMISTLLDGLQYNVLLYDKALIQAEFTVSGNDVVKERLGFMKKHNKIWDAEEIEEYENLDEDWFSEDYGVPIMLRVDFAPDDHIEGVHAKVHLTLSNHESCRIPIKGIVTFSEFVRFILFHFYDIKLDLKVCRSSADDTITELEKKMIHMNWS